MQLIFLSGNEIPVEHGCSEIYSKLYFPTKSEIETRDFRLRFWEFCFLHFQFNFIILFQIWIRQQYKQTQNAHTLSSIVAERWHCQCFHDLLILENVHCVAYSIFHEPLLWIFVHFPSIVAVSFTAKHRPHCSRGKLREWERERDGMCYNNIMCDWMLCIASPLLLLFFLLMEPSVVQSISFPFHSFHFSIVSFRWDQHRFSFPLHLFASIRFNTRYGSSSFSTYIFRFTLPFLRIECTMPIFRNPKKSSQSQKNGKRYEPMSLWVHIKPTNTNRLKCENVKVKNKKLAINKMLIQL